MFVSNPNKPLKPADARCHRPLTISPRTWTKVKTTSEGRTIGKRRRPVSDTTVAMR